MKHAVLIPLGLVLGMAAGGCPSVPSVDLSPGTYTGTLDCIAKSTSPGGTVDASRSFTRDRTFILSDTRGITYQGVAWRTGTSFTVPTTSGETWRETISGVTDNTTSVRLTTDVADTTGTSIWTGAHLIVISAISDTELDVQDSSLTTLQGSGSVSVECGGTLSR
jgi:hypothetical protein